MKIWRNGEIVDAKGAVDADDRGVTLGDGIFDTLAVINGNPLRLERHLRRLSHSADLLEIPFVADIEIWKSAINTVLAANDVTEGSVRITLLRGPGIRGVLPPPDLTPTSIVSVYTGHVGSNLPLDAIIATSTRRNEQSPLALIKNTNYLDAILARMEAENSGAEDAIMLNSKGLVAEATASNVFCVTDGQILTPLIEDGALPGIMRDCIIKERDVRQVSITQETLLGAEEVFLTSSLNIRPVVRLNGVNVGAGAPGPVAKSLHDFVRTTT